MSRERAIFSMYFGGGLVPTYLNLKSLHLLNTHTGVISDLNDTGFILNTELEPIIVNAPVELLANLADGMTATVYSNGAMTMSLPAQIAAEMITVTETIAD